MPYEMDVICPDEDWEALNLHKYVNSGLTPMEKKEKLDAISKELDAVAEELLATDISNVLSCIEKTLGIIESIKKSEDILIYNCVCALDLSTTLVTEAKNAITRLRRMRVKSKEDSRRIMQDAEMKMKAVSSIWAIRDLVKMRVPITKSVDKRREKTVADGVLLKSSADSTVESIQKYIEHLK